MDKALWIIRGGARGGATNIHKRELSSEPHLKKRYKLGKGQPSFLHPWLCFCSSSRFFCFTQLHYSWSLDSCCNLQSVFVLQFHPYDMASANSDEPSPAVSTVNDDGRSEAEIEARMLELLHQFPKGISNKILDTDMPTVNKQIKVNILNELMSKGKVSMFKAAGTQELFWCLKSHPTSGTKEENNEERVVLGLIEEAGNKGIWTKDIRIKSSLSQATLNKVLKALEGKKVIKFVSSVSAPKIKLYMLFNLQPDRSITGRLWYNNENNEFESELVDLLNHQCFEMLQQQKEIAQQKQNEGPVTVRNSSFLSSKEICQVSSDMKLVKFNLTVEDIETILDALVFEGKVEKSTASDGNCNEKVKMYRSVAQPVPFASITKTPCGVCPVINKCGKVGAIQPKMCKYFNEWE